MSHFAGIARKASDTQIRTWVRAAALAAGLSACGGGSSAPTTCAIPSGLYSVAATARTVAPECLAGNFMTAWPPLMIVTDAGPAGAQCSTSAVNGACEVLCYLPGELTPTTIDYTLTSGGYSGTETLPSGVADGGTADTCTYSIVATRE
jgi:hypothetical protein